MPRTRNISDPDYRRWRSGQFTPEEKAFLVRASKQAGPRVAMPSGIFADETRFRIGRIHAR